MKELLDEGDESDAIASCHCDNAVDAGAVDDARVEVSSCAAASRETVLLDRGDLLYYYEDRHFRFLAAEESGAWHCLEEA